MSIRDPDLRRIGTDPDSFEAFYREHVEAVQRFVARRVRDPERAADLTADIFLTVIRRAAEYRPERGPAIAWTFGIARTVVAESQRQRLREHRAVNRFAGLLPSRLTPWPAPSIASTPNARAGPCMPRWLASLRVSGPFSNSLP